MSNTPQKTGEIQGLAFIDPTPKWMKEYCQKVYSVLKLQVFTVNIHLVNRRTANRRLRKLNYETMSKFDLASAFVDPVYLTADIFITPPLINDSESRYLIFHEFLHIKFRYHTFDKVKLSLGVETRTDEAKLIRVEEETCEAMLSVFESLGAFSKAFV